MVKKKHAGLIGALAAGILASAVAPANAYAPVIETPTPGTPVVEQVFTYTPENPGRFIYPGETETTTTETNTVTTTPTILKTITTINTENLDEARANIIKTAMEGEGGTYVWGGKTFKSWDCSGYVSWVYKQQGIDLTAYTHAMKTELKKTDNPQPGDIVFTNNYEHVGIYLGEGKMISALNPSQGTLVTDVDGGGLMPVDGYYTAL